MFWTGRRGSTFQTLPLSEWSGSEILRNVSVTFHLRFRNVPDLFLKHCRLVTYHHSTNEINIIQTFHHIGAFAFFCICSVSVLGALQSRFRNRKGTFQKRFINEMNWFLPVFHRMRLESLDVRAYRGRTGLSPCWCSYRWERWQSARTFSNVSLPPAPRDLICAMS